MEKVRIRIFTKLTSFFYQIFYFSTTIFEYFRFKVGEKSTTVSTKVFPSSKGIFPRHLSERTLVMRVSPPCISPHFCPHLLLHVSFRRACPKQSLRGMSIPSKVPPWSCEVFWIIYHPTFSGHEKIDRRYHYHFWLLSFSFLSVDTPPPQGVGGGGGGWIPRDQPNPGGGYRYFRILAFFLKFNFPGCTPLHVAHGNSFPEGKLKMTSNQKKSL